MPDDLMFIGHMLDMAQRAQRLITGVSREEFDRDEKLQLALVRALQVIGEAAWRTSQTFQNANPQIPWRKIAGFRHRVIVSIRFNPGNPPWHSCTNYCLSHLLIKGGRD